MGDGTNLLVMAVALITWAGIWVWLARLSARVQALERRQAESDEVKK